MYVVILGVTNQQIEILNLGNNVTKKQNKGGLSYYLLEIFNITISPSKQPQAIHKVVLLINLERNDIINKIV